jgi:HAD superfamily hydrolase (TIGR01484 family)
MYNPLHYIKNTYFAESTMKNLKEFNSSIDFVLTDIDDTLTTEGQLPAEAYNSLWKLKKAGIKVIPITGRPAGWCEMIARFWPVEGVIGENGAFYFRYATSEDKKIKKMKRWFSQTPEVILKNKEKLKLIETEILQKIPETAISSDQFCRMIDLAIDFCEDIPPLAPHQIQQIVHIFENHGAIAKISSIHVNGWFGNHNKLTATFEFLKNEFLLTEKIALEKCIYVGDSPNDEPMFEAFPHSFGVANINQFKNELKHSPQYVSNLNGGDGFEEIAEHLLWLKTKV